MIGYHSDMMWLPEHGVGAVILTNGDPGLDCSAAASSASCSRCCSTASRRPTPTSPPAAKSYFDAARRRAQAARPSPPTPPTAAKLAARYANAALGEIAVSTSRRRHRRSTSASGRARSRRSRTPTASISFVTIAPGVTGFEFVVGTRTASATLVTARRAARVRLLGGREGRPLALRRTQPGPGQGVRRDVRPLQRVPRDRSVRWDPVARSSGRPTSSRRWAGRIRRTHSSPAAAAMVTTLSPASRYSLATRPEVVARSRFDFLYGTADRLVPGILQSIDLDTRAGFEVIVDAMPGAGHCNKWKAEGRPTFHEQISRSTGAAWPSRSASRRDAARRAGAPAALVLGRSWSR